MYSFLDRIDNALEYFERGGARRAASRNYLQVCYEGFKSTNIAHS